MRKEARALHALRSQTARAPQGTALLGFIEQRAQAAGIGGALSQLAPRGSRKAEAVFEKVPFNALVRFLAGLGAHGIAPAEVAVSPAGRGLVSGSVMLAANA